MRQQDASPAPWPTAKAVVLDTNVVLALYWFQDTRLGRLAQALQCGQLRWLATAEMRQELRHVLERWQQARSADGPCGAPHGAGLGGLGVLQMFDHLAEQVTAPAPGASPRCTDVDDQKFIDLALSCRSSWLLSRDRAVLQLRRKLLAIADCTVLRPEDWAG